MFFVTGIQKGGLAMKPKQVRKYEALVRREHRADRTPREQLDRLDFRGEKAAKERNRLNIKVNKGTVQCTDQLEQIRKRYKFAYN